MAAVVPLITNWLNSDVAQRFDLSSLAGRAERRRAAARRSCAAVFAHEFGCTPQEIYGTAEGLINMTRLDDARRPAARELRCAGQRVGRDRGRRRRGPRGARRRSRASWSRAARTRFAATTTRRDDQRRGVHGRRLLPDGRHRPEARPLRLHRGPSQGPHQPRRREDQLRRGREPDLRAQPKVGRSALVAMPDPVFGEKACACVVLQPGTELTFERADRAPAGAADRLVQVARTARGDGLLSGQPGRQDPEARTPRDRRTANRTGGRTVVTVDSSRCGLFLIGIGLMSASDLVRRWR